MRLSSSTMAFSCWFLRSYMNAEALSSDLVGNAKGDVGRHGVEAVALRHGVLFQTGGCPQALTPEEAKVHVVNGIPSGGNAITLASQTQGRAGNHFEDLSQHFSMAYCCRSSLLVLPEGDNQIPTMGKGNRKAKHRWYDFSNANMDLLPEFADLSRRPDVCIHKRSQSGLRGYGLGGVHPDLLRCLNHVFVRGCEADYMGPVVNTNAFCPPKGVGQNGIDASDNHQRRRKSRTLDVLQSPATSLALAPQRIGAGSLVIHIRSGDIFNPRDQGTNRPDFGQPPLKFFLDVIASKAWSDVTVLTYAQQKFTNPTFTALRLLKRSGMLGPNVILHNNRPLVDDLRAMLCADALAVSRSSLHFLTFSHSRASTFYLPDSCGVGRSKRESHAKNFHLPKRHPDNSTLLILEKAEAEVYGIEWTEDRDSYSPYAKWADTDGQLLEMLTFDGIKGLKRCSITD